MSDSYYTMIHTVIAAIPPIRMVTVVAFIASFIILNKRHQQIKATLYPSIDPHGAWLNLKYWPTETVTRNCQTRNVFHGKIGSDDVEWIVAKSAFDGSCKCVSLVLAEIALREHASVVIESIVYSEEPRPQSIMKGKYTNGKIESFGTRLVQWQDTRGPDIQAQGSKPPLYSLSSGFCFHLSCS
jgi:hypothetical protein